MQSTERPGQPRPMAGDATHETVQALLDGPRGGVVLDAGAGQGAFTHVLGQCGFPVVATGIRPQQFTPCGADYVVCDCDTPLPFRDESLEGVVAIELIEHLEMPFGFVRDVVRCLARDGWFIVTTPNVLSLASKTSFALRNVPAYFGDREFQRNGHISPVSLIDLERIASRCGLRVEQVRYSVGKLPIPRIRHRLPLRHEMFRTRAFGESVIVKMRKTGAPVRDFARG